MEWFRFWLTAALLIFSLFCFTSAVLGTYRFGYALNRIHASGIGDTLGLSAAVAASMIGSGELMTILKMLLIVVFMWFTSPVSAHFLGQIEYYMDRSMEEHTRHYRLAGQTDEPSGAGAAGKEDPS